MGLVKSFFPRSLDLADRYSSKVTSECAIYMLEKVGTKAVVVEAAGFVSGGDADRDTGGLLSIDDATSGPLCPQRQAPEQQ
ncbi:hypothetical protein [Sphingomonas natans]|uniref:hypothetical protein n=1 Tax=Sphingomonas natans TaxID=3063330 RepID=UPI0026E20081|nr:hypothetical protein [Sphingomonas sp. BIUV-7]